MFDGFVMRCHAQLRQWYLGCLLQVFEKPSWCSGYIACQCFICHAKVFGSILFSNILFFYLNK
jgi:hypothetical protein